MSNRPTPSYVAGRGRGRATVGGGVSPSPGVGSNSIGGKPAVAGNTNKADIVRSNGSSVASTIGYSAKFEEVKTQHQQSIEHHLKTLNAATKDEILLSSDEEDNDNDGVCETDVINSVKTNFLSSSADSCMPYAFGRTEDYIINAFNSKANVCLVCIDSIKRTHQIWTCQGCYTIFHIQCIQKWVRDGVYQHTALSNEHFPNRDMPWFWKLDEWKSPKCRFQHSQRECPTQYRCYCGKEVNPKIDPWLVPHSCGQPCERPLKPPCGHQCKLLCHPGPCPPCPQVVRLSCYCQKSAPAVRRCGTSGWTCGQPCKKPLQCGQHVCSSSCHDGPCPVCSKTSSQQCQCLRNNTIRPCHSPQWQCNEVCGKMLACGHHTCAEVCHKGPCKGCPTSGNRTCPCGKTKFDLPCTEEAPTCLETCGKLLDCRLHYCTERCHTGPCGTCREMVRKKCKCGKRDREIQCFKEFQCDVKCAKLRDCKVHQCKRKCCDGSCPPCTQICGKTLGCRQHKCNSACHVGLCYPCPIVVDVFCNCRQTKLTVPCGAEKTTRAPKCRLPCRNPPDCHHESRVEHHCHFGNCPPCQLICDQQLPHCQHRCLSRCHTAVLEVVDPNPKKFPAPWDPPSSRTKQMQVVKKPCPPCAVKVPIVCLGEHESFQVACSEAVRKSCGRKCERPLPCTNHTCQLECHLVSETPCEECEEPCLRKRPVGCKHQCPLSVCHADQCPPCQQMLRMRCHCSLVVLHVQCSQWSEGGDVERSNLQSCRGSCPKPLACGHRCNAVCHPPPCVTENVQCKEKVKMKCRCGFRKVEMKCYESKTTAVVCDEACEQQKLHQQKVKRSSTSMTTQPSRHGLKDTVKLREEAERRHEEAERQRHQAELEEFERKSSRRKRSRNRHNNADSEQSRGQYILSLLTSSYAMVALIVAALAVAFYWLVANSAV